MSPKLYGWLISPWKIVQHLDIKEIQIKIIMRHAYISIIIANIIKTDYTLSELGCEAMGNLNCWWHISWYNHFGKYFKNFLNVKHVAVIWIAFLLLGICPRETNPMFIQELVCEFHSSLTFKKWKQCKCPSTEQRQIVIYTYRRIILSIKMNYWYL